MSKTIIRIEDINAALKVLNDFDKLDLQDVVLTENNESIEVPKDSLAEWKFIGLSNSLFVEDRYWENYGQLF